MSGMLAIATRVAYEAMRNYMAGVEGQKTPEAPPFDQAGLEFTAPVARSLLLFLLNPHAPASMIHQVATRNAMDDGWTYGEKYDEAQKTDWRIRPWNELPQWMQDCDAIVHGVANALRGRVTRDELEHARQMAAPKPQSILLS